MQKKQERFDQEDREAAEFIRDMEERKRRLGSVYTGERRQMERERFSGLSQGTMRSPGAGSIAGTPREKPATIVEAPRKPEKVVLVPDNLW